MTRAERRKDKKKYEKDFAHFCRIMKLYFPDFIHWLFSLEDPRKFWTYETEVILMTVVMKNVCCIDSMQQMTDEFIKDGCVKNLCTVLGVPEHEFFPHYVPINELTRMDTEELEKLRSLMVHALLRRRKFEDARLPGKYWMVIFDVTGLFHFKERHCPHCLKKVLNKETENEQAVYYQHVLEAKPVLGEGFVVSIGTEFIENENEDVSQNDCETKAFAVLAVQKVTLTFQWLIDFTVPVSNSVDFAEAGRDRWCIENQGFNIQKNILYDIQHADSLDYNAMKCHYLLTQISDILMQLYGKERLGIRKAKNTIKNISSGLLKSFGELLTGEDISFMSAYGYVKAACKSIIAKGSGLWQDKKFNYPQKINCRFFLLWDCGKLPGHYACQWIRNPG